MATASRNWARGLIVGNSLLTARGIPASGEGDLKTCIAMLIMDRLRAGGSYTEFYAMDFNDDFILMGHDGPGHVAISDRKPMLRGLGLFHGKRGYGISVEFKVKYGPDYDPDDDANCRRAPEADWRRKANRFLARPCKSATPIRG